MKQLTLFELEDLKPTVTISYTAHPYKKNGALDRTKIQTWTETKPKNIVDDWIKHCSKGWISYMIHK